VLPPNSALDTQLFIGAANAHGALMLLSIEQVRITIT